MGQRSEANSILIIYTCKERVQENRLLSKCFLSWPQQRAFTILMSGQLASQDWQPAPRNQRRHLDRTSGGKCLTPHFCYSSYSKHAAHRKPLAVCVWHQLDVMMCTHVWDSSVTTNPTTVSLSAVIRLWGNYWLMLIVTDAFVFHVFELMPRDTSTWGGSLQNFSAIFYLHERKQAQVSLLAAHPSLRHLHPHIVPNADRDSLVLQRVRLGGKWELYTGKQRERTISFG